MNRVIRRVEFRGHADILPARRQLGLLSDVTAALLPALGLGKTKTNTPSKPTQPPGNGNTPAAPKPVITATPVNGGPPPTGSSVAGGGNHGNSGGSNSNGGGSDNNGGGGGTGGSSGGGGSGSSSGGDNNSGSSGGGSNGGGSSGDGSNGGGSSGGGSIVSGSGGGGSNDGSNGGGSSGGGNGGIAGGSPASSANRATSVISNGTPSRPTGTPSANSPFAGGTTISNNPDSHSGIVNVGSGPPGSANEGSPDLNPGTGISGIGTPGGPPGSNPSTIVNTSGDGKTSTAAGVIAAAIILSLLFVIAVVVFVLRRRSRTRRDELSINWWFTRNRTSQSYGDNEALNTGSSSHRSSFATTLDHSNASSFGDAAIPPPPPMAEIGRHIGTEPTLVLDINADPNRFSIGSANSHSSQFLVVHHRESLQHENSASLMSCTESFPFPKPPPADRSLYPKSCEWSRTGSPKKRESEVLSATSPTSIRSITPPGQIRPTLRNPFAADDPFDDLAPLNGTVLEYEAVHRPFIPQLHDELEVNIGDSVRIIRSYDDGWAFVEKLSSVPNGEQGLIPLNCLLYLGQDILPGAKRMSSQGVNHA